MWFLNCSLMIFALSNAEGFWNFNLVELILIMSILEQDVSYHLSVSSLLPCTDLMLLKPRHVSVTPDSLQGMLKGNFISHIRYVKIKEIRLIRIIIFFLMIKIHMCMCMYVYICYVSSYCSSVVHGGPSYAVCCCVILVCQKGGAVMFRCGCSLELKVIV